VIRPLESPKGDRARTIVLPVYGERRRVMATGSDVPITGDGLLDGGLVMSARQEQFSLGFVRMVAAAAGCSVKTHETDYDGVDITVVASTEYETWYCPEIELQVKCTSQHRLLREDSLSWSMKRDRFLKLTNPKRYTPAFLAVLLVPAEDEPLLRLDHDGFMSASRMYWQAASQLGAIPDGQANKTVNLPTSNLFDVEALQGIMQVVGEGGTW
jgi:hypothetical protein